MSEVNDLFKHYSGKIIIEHKPDDKGKLWHFGLDTDGNIVKIIPENVVLDLVVK